MKKTMIGLALALCMLLGLAACTNKDSSSQSLPATASSEAASKSEPVSAVPSEPATASEGENAVSGNVVSNTVDTLEMMTADGHSFKFPTTNVEIEPPADGIMEGDLVTVYYEGKLDESLETQTVKVIRMEVAHE